ncbi:MAG: GAF domain-containing protein, partial [candidate division Zixibacteria bacterium]
MESLQKTLNMIEQLETKLGYQQAQLRDLATMGTIITSIHEIDAVLSVVMDLALRLVDGEVGLMLTEDHGQLVQRVSWGVSEDFVRTLKYKDDQDLAEYCFRNKEPVVLADLELESDTGMQLQSLVAVPIKTSEKCLGVLIILNKTSGGNFYVEDKDALEMLLNFVAVAVENSRLMKQQLKQQKVEQEMAIAKQVQETLLPQDV